MKRYPSLQVEVYKGDTCVRVVKYLKFHVKSFGNSLLIRTSTTGTCFPSASIDAKPGSFPFELTITTRCNRAEVVFLRLEAKRISSSMKSSVRLQSKNARVFSEGGEDGFENRTEKRYDTLVSQLTASVSRAGKNDGWKTVGLRGDSARSDLRCTRRNSRMVVRVRGRRGNSAKGSSGPWRHLNEKTPCGPSNRMSRQYDWHSMNVGEDRFERFVAGTPDRMPLSVALELR